MHENLMTADDQRAITFLVGFRSLSSERTAAAIA
jgi:hypothetical protein